jgi:tRNA(Ile)-lysidine synthase
MYHGAVETLAQSVVAYIRKHQLLKAGDRVGAAVSGGADSVALLRLLLELRPELGIVLSVVHFNHKLRKEASEADERFVAELAQSHGLEMNSSAGDVSGYAEQKHLSLETAAREMRYGFFFRLLREGAMNRLATGHTLDDQAETVLFRIVRGAGTRGLAGIYPQFSVLGSQFSEGDPLAASSPQEGRSIVRPLLGIRRNDIEAYLASLGQERREDASNRDLRHARNRVRHEILPRLERDLNPAVREMLAETAEIARVEEEYWEHAVKQVLRQFEADPRSLNLRELLALPLALQRRVLRAVTKPLGLRLEFRQVEKILAVAEGRARAAVLADGWCASRSHGMLSFHPAEAMAEADYEYPLPVPGGVEIVELGTRLEAVLVSASGGQGYNPENLLNPDCLGNELRVRNWRAGDRFWPAHTKGPKKIKELLQDRHIDSVERRLWPVAVSAGEVVWVRGFAIPQRLQAVAGGRDAVMIREFRG